ncbi:MAG: hypothetical protein J4F36_14195 [Nitrosopumilaceae archaeon]|nr:hypothetical protein [Nitrosopumilaceae archaeon]
MDKLKIFRIVIFAVPVILMLLIWAFDPNSFSVIGSIFVSIFGALITLYLYGEWDRRRQKNGARESICSNLELIKHDIDEKDSAYQSVSYTLSKNNESDSVRNDDGELRSTVSKTIHSSFKIECFGIKPNNNSVRFIDMKIRNKISEESNWNDEIKIKYTAVLFSTGIFDSIFSSGQFLLFNSDYQLKIQSLYDLLKKHNECLSYILKLEDTLVTNKTLDDCFESLIIPYEIKLSTCESDLQEIIDYCQESKIFNCKHYSSNLVN